MDLNWFAERIKMKSMGFMITVPIVLIVIMMIFPLTTSLGQGINENVIIGFEGIYEPATQAYWMRLYYQGGSQEEIAITPLAVGVFNKHLSSSMWVTAMNDPGVLKAAFLKDPIQLKRELGTYYNAPGIFAPFPRRPVAYTTGFLKALAKEGVNPATYGGPDIPPASVPYSKLQGGMLQVDTLKGGNIIAQCQPGQVPPQLLLFNPALKAKQA